MHYELIRSRSTLTAVILSLLFGYALGTKAFAEIAPPAQAPLPEALRLSQPASLPTQLEGSWRSSRLQAANCIFTNLPCPLSASERAFTASVLKFTGEEVSLEMLVCPSSEYQEGQCRVVPICEDIPKTRTGLSRSEIIDCQNTRVISAKVRLDDACTSGHQGVTSVATSEIETVLLERRRQVCQEAEVRIRGGFQLIVLSGKPFPFHGTFFRLDQNRRLLMESLPLFSSSSKDEGFSFDDMPFLRM